MREKLLELMKREKLKPSQLAEKLEINPAGISHILSGRNKPSFELLQKILRRFPRINPDWLLLDSEEIYRDGQTPDGDSLGSSTPESEPTLPGINDGIAGNPKIEAIQDNATPDSARSHGSVIPNLGPAGKSRSEASVQRIIIFYDDQTCECYVPTKR